MVRKLIFEVCANCGEKIADDEAAILVDSENDLIFCSNVCVHEQFESEISALEKEHQALRSKADIPLRDFPQYDQYLNLVLEDPDEIWSAETHEEETPLAFYIGEFLDEDEDDIFYVVAAYFTDEKPTFVYTHFPTKDPKLVEKFRRGQLIYDAAETEEVDYTEDEISEDHPAFELYEEMLDGRTENDIDIVDFSSYEDLRLSTVEHPKEIWRYTDEESYTFLIYFAPYLRDSEIVTYIVVAIEDEVSENVIPLFGFPTLDSKLVERFRKGEIIHQDKNQS